MLRNEVRESKGKKTLHLNFFLVLAKGLFDLKFTSSMNTTSFHFFSATKNGLVPLIRSNLHLFVGESNSLAKRGKNKAKKDFLLAMFSH